jgi:hypothetical protein
MGDFFFVTNLNNSMPVSMPTAPAPVRSSPPKFKPHSFNLPVALLNRMERLARREAKGARPNLSNIARRAIMAEVTRCEAETPTRPTK